MVDLDKIQRAAEAATPGPWLVDQSYPIMIASQSETWPLVDDGEEVGRTGAFIANTGDSTDNAQFIAACDPQTILKLIAVVREAQGVCFAATKEKMRDLREALEALS